jgi:hypothetical protein
MKTVLVFRRCGVQPTLELGLSWDKAHMTFRSSDDPEPGVGKQENGAPEEIRTPNLLIRSQKDDVNFWRFSAGFRALVSTFESKPIRGFLRVSRGLLKLFWLGFVTSAARLTTGPAYGVARCETT